MEEENWLGLASQVHPETGDQSRHGSSCGGDCDCIPVCSVNCLAGVFLIQAWIMWNFITFHLHRARERANAEAPVINKKLNSPSSPQRKKKRGPSVFTSLLTSILKTNFCHQKQAQLLYFVIIYFRLTDIFPGEAGSAGSPSSSSSGREPLWVSRTGFLHNGCPSSCCHRTISVRVLKEHETLIPFSSLTLSYHTVQDSWQENRCLLYTSSTTPVPRNVLFCVSKCVPMNCILMLL